ncbi:sigma factor-like helix-turn-helix DNA-binding protein [Anaerovoracaceae bacterium 41-7]|uniref:Sigma-70 family RNA polymerase sigma factor n=1 Tax=Anaerotruncus colihominis TaxID=169435 RepID=A0A845QIU9_9FIRM|nr:MULTISPECIES: sigma factor-like helix-turn-helix DNA-binding protein [Anaerotruncus]MCI9639866.1 sigma-70 family RNA polymerase sigma factor [Emergencia sp.]NBH60905.1 sigma-70 family RNA polymerase sigma factor [Anaerotruncus colihominis]NCF01560.1 sigma-70 family RNA polymerase sigma factor [Anaerotruncus sp. 80]
MKQKIYLLKNTEFNTNSHAERLVEVTGNEFYHYINAAGSEKKYFVHITDNLFFEAAEIIVEVSASDYYSWKKEYDRLYYQAKLSEEISEISWDNLNAKIELNPEIIPEESLLKKENYWNLKRALLSLETDERKLIGMLYLSEKPATMRQAAEHFGVSVSAIHKRKEKILKKMKNFW